MLYQQIIYMKNSETIQLEKIFLKLNIKKNDNIYLGVDLMKTSLNLKTKMNFNKLSEIILKTLSKIVGSKGSIVVPTFNFHCINEKKFDVKKSPSNCGAFSNILLRKYFKQRSFHPMYSFLFFGKNSSYFINKKEFNAFGVKSIWQKFIENNYKIVSLGHHYNRSFTIVHHLENLSSIDYRYNKTFSLNYKDLSNKIKKIKFQFFARKKNKCKYSAITIKCDQILRKKRIFKFHKYKKLISFNLNLKKSCMLILNDLKKEKPVFVNYIDKKNNNLRNILNSKNTFELEQYYTTKY